ncbi:MAG: hypothetical protein IPP29_16320 [Bacteroidetes bacterium]|nr:hypothetical protein [Bacteroidota bacterium]
MMFNNEFNSIVDSFNTANVEFMIVGGYAVNFHGYSRTTSDLDIWVKSTDENKLKICTAISTLGYTSEKVDQIRIIDFSKPFLFRIGSENEEVEIFNIITGVEFDDALKTECLF